MSQCKKCDGYGFTSNRTKFGPGITTTCPACSDKEKPTTTPTKTPLSLDKFSEAQADEASGKLADNYYNNPFKMFVEGARWQHSKDKAVIQELRAENAILKQTLKHDVDKIEAGYLTEIQALKAENERLTVALRYISVMIDPRTVDENLDTAQPFDKNTVATYARDVLNKQRGE